MKKYIHFKEIDSTNTYLKNHHSQYDDLTFVSASYQLNGHGRMNRVWQSNKNENIMFSLLIKNSILIEKFSTLSLLMASCVYKLLTGLKIKDVKIKWPNDVYVNNKKICGILLEGIGSTCLVLGIGLNVNQKLFEDKNAISITNITNKKYNLYLLKRKLYKIILNEINMLLENKSDYLHVIKNNDYLMNKEVYTTINNQKELVKVLKINDDNSLKVLLNNKEYDLISGEITFHS